MAIGKEFSIFSGDRIRLDAEPNAGKLTITADAQVENVIDENSTTKAPSGKAVDAAIKAAKEYADQKFAAVVAPTLFKGYLDKESEVPSDTSTLAAGMYYEIKNLDTSKPGYSGRMIWDGARFQIIPDMMRTVDGTTIGMRSSDGALEVSEELRQKIDKKIDTPTDGSRLITPAEISKLNDVTSNPIVNSVAGRTGVVTLTKADVGLSQVDDTSDANKPVSTATQSALDAKVDKVAGKQLSTEDFTTEYKGKLDNLATSGEANQNAFSFVKVGAQTITASSKTDTFTLVAGDNVTIEVDENAKTITVKADKDAILANAITGIKVNGNTLI